VTCIRKVSRTLFPVFFLLVFSPGGWAQNADINLLKNINLHRSVSMDPFFRTVTNSTYPISLAIPLAMFGKGYFKKDSLLINESIQVGTALLVSTIISEGLKQSIQRQRPFVTYPFIQKATEGADWSFPSGHVSIAFATATSLSILNHKWYVVIPAFAWAGTIAYSRMDLGVHYPSDVLAGAIIGSASSIIAYKLNKWLMTRTVFRRISNKAIQ
jgi:membrane-associated phospholipid phosphatase